MVSCWRRLDTATAWRPLLQLPHHIIKRRLHKAYTQDAGGAALACICLLCASCSPATPTSSGPPRPAWPPSSRRQQQ